MSNGIDRIELVHVDSFNKDTFARLKENADYNRLRNLYQLRDKPYTVCFKKHSEGGAAQRKKWKYGVKFITNPNEYPSFHVMLKYLERTTDVPIMQTRVSRLDFNYDLPKGIDSWKNFIDIKFKQRHTNFYEECVCQENDEFSSINDGPILNGFHVGGKDSEERISIYTQKNSNTTRLEIKLTKRKLPVRFMSELADVLSTGSFAPFIHFDVRKWEIIDGELITKKREIAANEYKFLTDHTYLFFANRKLKKHKRLLQKGCIKYDKKFDVDSMWRSKIVRFLEAA